MARNDDTEIEVGQRFYRVGQFSSVWVVKQLMFSEKQSLPHVVIEKHGASGEVDIVPLYVLEDPSNYRPDRRSLEPVVADSPRRRAIDQADEAL